MKTKKCLRLIEIVNDFITFECINTSEQSILTLPEGKIEIILSNNSIILMRNTVKEYHHEEYREKIENVGKALCFKFCVASVHNLSCVRRPKPRTLPSRWLRSDEGLFSWCQNLKELQTLKQFLLWEMSMA